MEELTSMLDAIAENNNSILSNTARNVTNFRKDMVLVTNSAGRISASKVKKEKLLFLNNLTSPIQYQIDEIADKLTNDLDTAYISAFNDKKTKIYNLSLNISTIATNVSFDNIQDGVRNKFIVNDELNSDLTITGALTVTNNIHISNAYTNVDTTIYETNSMRLTQENLASPPVDPILRVTQKGVLNIIDMYYISNNLLLKPDERNLYRLSITNDGSMGVGTNKPLEKLDVRGKLGVSGKINDVTAEELNNLHGLENNLQYMLDEIVEDSSVTTQQWNTDCTGYQSKLTEEINGILTTVTNATEEMQTNVELFMISAADSKQDTLVYGDGIDYDPATNSMYTTRTSQWAVSQDGEQITFGNIKIAQDTFCVDDGVNVVNFVSQSQFDLKQSKASVTGAVTTITTNDLTPSKILISDPNRKIGIDSNVSVEKLQFLNGVKSSIQGQIDTLNQRISDTVTEINPIANNYTSEYNAAILTKLTDKNAELATKQDAITFGQGLEYDSNTGTLQISGAVQQSYTGTTNEPQKEYWKGRYFFNNTDNLMTWYTFDNNNFLLNNGYLGKDYNLINNGATADTSAAVGDASANINSGYLQISKDIDTTGLKECTVAFWLKKDAILNAGGNDVIVSDQNVNVGSEMNFRITRNGTGDDWKIECFGATFLTASALADWSDGNTSWNHYSVVMHKTDVSNTVSIEIFKNGVSEFTDSSSSTWTTGISKSIRIGYDGDVNRQLKGHLDDVRIYDKKLSADEITKLYTKNTTVEYLAYGDNDYDRRVFYNELTDMPIWYKFDSSDDLTVNSGNTGIANDLVNVNAVVNATDFIAGSACATFDNTSTMTIGDFDFNTSTEYSICFWLRKNVNSASDDDVIVTSAIDNTPVFKISKTDALWTIQAFGSTFTNVWVADTTWHHYCFKFIKTTPTSGVLLQIYKDGKIINTLINQATAWTSGVAQLQLGTFVGDLDDFRIYNRAITTGEINVLYFTGGFTNMYEYVNDTTDMIAWYKFDGDFTDSSGNGYDLENTDCTIDTNAPAVGSGSVKFTGSSYLTYNTSSIAFSQDVMTICFWAYVTGTGVSQIISTQSGANGWMFQVDGSNNFKYFISNTQGVVFAFGTEGNPVYNSWFHVVVILSQNTNNQYIYINGKLKSTIATTYTSNVSSTLRIGAQVGTASYYMKNDSKVDDIRIYNRVLTQDEVSYIYNYNNENLDIYNNRGLLTTSSSVVRVYDDGIALKPNEVVQPTATIIHNGVTVQPTPIDGTDYVYAAFTSTTGTNSIEFDQNTVCDILVVAGGGRGGNGLGGGGGGGGVVHITNVTAPSGTYNVVVGAGGTQSNGNGGDSSFGTLLAKGGGYGGIYSNSSIQGTQGGSSGGNGGVYSLQVGTDPLLALTPEVANYTFNTVVGTVYGNKGGGSAARDGLNALGGSGGGGAGGLPDPEITPGKGVAGKGGDGIGINITGEQVFYGAGGGGGGYIINGAEGGLGGGGMGGSENPPDPILLKGQPGLANTGSGGGGGGWQPSGRIGGDGGSGIVIVRWKSFAPKFVATVDDVANKQNALTFGKGLEYDPTAKQLIAGGWKETEYLSKGNVKIYGNKISLLTTTQDVAAPMRKYPPAVMSSASETLTASYGSGVYTASISTTDASFAVNKCFDGVTTGSGGGFATGAFDKSIISDYTGEWIKLVMPVRIHLSYINIYSVTANPGNAPSNYRIYGSNDGTNWTQLLDVTSAQYTSDKHTSPNIYTKPLYHQYAICVQQTVASGTALEIAEIELYGRETSPTISAEEFYNDATDIIAWYKFDGDLTDSSGNNKTLTLNGTSTFQTGINESAFYFNNNARLYADTSLDWTPESFTISFWMSTVYQSVSSSQHIVRAYDNANGSLGGWWISISGNSVNALRLGLYFAIQTPTQYLGRLVVSKEKILSSVVNDWVHITYTLSYDKVSNISTMRCYINGLLLPDSTEPTYDGTGVLPVGSTTFFGKQETNLNTLTFGANTNNTGKLYSTKLDDVRIYNRALSAEEISVLYNIDSIRETLRPTSGNGSISTDITTVQNIKPLYSSDTINVGNHIEICNGKNQTGLVGATAMSVTGNAAATTTSYCMRSKRDIWVDGADVIFTSDERIKKDIKDIEDDSALEKLLAIEPKTYKYIDYKTRGTEKVYGFVSQQVRSVLPEATAQTQRFIPNIYKYCFFKDNIIYLPADFDVSKLVSTYNGQVTSTQLRLIDHHQTVHDVSFSVVFESDPPQLRIKGAIPIIRNSNQIFVYGTLIDDLVTIDKSYVYTLNVCATQSLSRKIDTMNSDISAVNSRTASIENRLAALEAKMNP